MDSKETPQFLEITKVLRWYISSNKVILITVIEKTIDIFHRQSAKLFFPRRGEYSIQKASLPFCSWFSSSLLLPQIQGNTDLWKSDLNVAIAPWGLGCCVICPGFRCKIPFEYENPPENTQCQDWPKSVHFTGKDQHIESYSQTLYNRKVQPVNRLRYFLYNKRKNNE